MDEQYIVCKFGETLTCGGGQYLPQSIVSIYTIGAFCAGVVLVLWFYHTELKEDIKELKNKRDEQWKIWWALQKSVINAEVESKKKKEVTKDASP